MLDRKDHMGAPDLHHLNLAHRWLVQLDEAGSKQPKAAELSKK